MFGRRQIGIIGKLEALSLPDELSLADRIRIATERAEAYERRAGGDHDSLMVLIAKTYRGMARRFLKEQADAEKKSAS